MLTFSTKGEVEDEIHTGVYDQQQIADSIANSKEYLRERKYKYIKQLWLCKKYYYI